MSTEHKPDPGVYAVLALLVAFAIGGLYIVGSMAYTWIEHPDRMNGNCYVYVTYCTVPTPEPECSFPETRDLATSWCPDDPPATPVYCRVRLCDAPDQACTDLIERLAAKCGG
jgi:hypothetical protein